MNGGSGGDHLQGSERGDYLLGGPGDDAFYGGGGNDIIAAQGGFNDFDSTFQCGETAGVNDADTAYVDINEELAEEGDEGNCEFVKFTAPPAAP
jgi:hypothetical protein